MPACGAAETSQLDGWVIEGTDWSGASSHKRRGDRCGRPRADTSGVSPTGYPGPEKTLQPALSLFRSYSLLNDKFHDHCGVFAVCGHPEAAKLTYLGLYALQHRGQESA